MANYFDNLVSVIFQEKCEPYAVSSFFSVRICCCSLLFMIVNEVSLGFGLLVGKRKQFEDVTLGKLISRLIDNENNCRSPPT